MTSFNYDNSYRRIIAEASAQSGRKLGCQFNAGKTAATDNHGIARSGGRARDQGVKMLLKGLCGFKLIDIKGVLSQPGNRWTLALTAGGQH